jgi:hypothetical protein
MPSADERPEGIYLSSSTYPPNGGSTAATLYRIERVNGDRSVSSLELTRLDAVHVVNGLRCMLKPK